MLVDNFGWPKAEGDNGGPQVEDEYVDALDAALIKWSERSRAYESWRDEFFPLVTELLDPETRKQTRPVHHSIECIEEGERLRLEVDTAWEAYLGARRKMAANLIGPTRRSDNYS